MNKSIFLKIILLCIISLCCNILAYGVQSTRSLNPTLQIGNIYTTKPNLCDRINGVTDIILVRPYTTSRIDDSLLNEISNYFQNLGLPITYYETKYEKSTQDRGGAITYTSKCLLTQVDFVESFNTLLIIPAYIGYAKGAYNSFDIVISIVDIVGGYQWNITIESRYDMDKGRFDKKFQSKLKKNISESYEYNDKYSLMPLHWITDWNEYDFKNYYEEVGFNMIEGLYQLNGNRIAIKKENNKLYGIYISGSDIGLWRTGIVKVELEFTATPNLFHGSFWDRHYGIHSINVVFKPGYLTIIEEGKDPISALKLYPGVESLQNENTMENNKWSGTGFALKNGYIVTNEHVVDNAIAVEIFGINGDFTKGYSADVIGIDRNNDLALLRIKDNSLLDKWITPPFSIDFSISEVGENVYVMGFPLIGTMGEEIKLTNGIISSLSGYKGDISNYQISVPVQPGNSGGPMFNEKGNLTGIVCAKHNEAENVSYAIKTSYLKNLLETSATLDIVPKINSLTGKPLKDQVKTYKNFVFLIKCSN